VHTCWLNGAGTVKSLALRETSKNFWEQKKTKEGKTQTSSNSNRVMQKLRKQTRNPSSRKN